MLKSYLKITLRNLRRHKIYTLINILGLSLGMACVMLLFLYIQDEMSYDKSFKNSNLIYRGVSIFTIQDKEDRSATTPGILAPTLLNDYPEVESFTRLRPRRNVFMQYGEKKFNQKKCFFADKDFFEVFDYQFLYGTPQKALSESNTIVLTKSLAEKIFGNPAEAVGRSIMIDFQGERSFLVSAVIENKKENSHLQFEALLSMETLFQEEKKLPENQHESKSWGSVNYYSYLKIAEGADIKTLEAKMETDIYKKYMEKDFAQFDFKGYFKLQPITDIRLYSTYKEETTLTNTIIYVYVFSAVALFILVIAAINYMNLATARSAGRAKEVGIRKVLGAYRTQLIGQFLTESILITFVSALISLSMTELALPAFNQLAGKNLVIDYFGNPAQILAFISIALLVGLLSGSYPALFLSGFKPVLVLKGKFSNNRNSVFLRKGLVVVQFVISTTMIIGTWIVYQQLNYVRNTDLGFDQEQVLVINLPADIRSKAELIKSELLQNSEILKVAATNAIPGSDEFNSNGVRVENANGEMKDALVQSFHIDQDYLDLMGIQIKEGRNYDKNLLNDTANSVIVNETLVRNLSLGEQALGKKFINLSDAPSLDSIDFAAKAKVIAVTKNFHLASLHSIIEPTVLLLTAKAPFKLPRRLLVKLKANPSSETMTFIEKVYENFDKKHPFESYFLDQNFARQYEADEKRGQIFMIFSFLTIFIACLGLFGLASFTAEQRTKEIGIRKVMGASTSSLIILLSRQFLQLVLVANLIAFPLAWYTMNEWLQSFAYRTEVWENWYVFILAAILTLFIAILTISVQAYRAASTNPVNVLKNE